MNKTQVKPAQNGGQSDGSQMRITPDEQALIKSTFLNNEPLVRLMRKMFLPELDPNAPIGQMIDLWMTVPVKDVSPEQALINIMARNQLIAHLDQVLLQIHLISKMETENEADAKAKLVADGAE